MSAISGFPEYTPQQQRLASSVLSSLRSSFLLSGYEEISTRSVEPVSALSASAGGDDVSKEMYAVSRLASDKPAALGLRFDLTVPFARYVEQFQSELVFPFRKFQIQQVWRGERAQYGRFREFYQADVDIVGKDSLSPRADSEVPLVMLEALASIGVTDVEMRANSRSLLNAICDRLGVNAADDALRVMDKLSKIGVEVARQELRLLGAESLVDVAAISASDVDEVRSALTGILGEWDTLLESELMSVSNVVERVNESGSAAVIDLSICRGLGYYTGVVFETFIRGAESLGSVCSGGRYESLIGGGKFPGIGMSIGVTRLLAWMLDNQSVDIGRPDTVFIVLDDEDSDAEVQRDAQLLRSRSFAAVTSLQPVGYGKQIREAVRRGIRYVWFPRAQQMRDLETGQQKDADLSSWAPK